MLLTESYREQNKQLHKRGNYGIKGHIYADAIAMVCASVGTTDLLDYGCGQGTLKKALPFPIREYDPCIAGVDKPPEPADVVACTDVLEHIEPECLDAVLDDLRRVTRMAGFFAIDTRPAKKVLPDGRNAHLIQQGADWWFPRLYERFSVVQIKDVLYESQTAPGLIKSLGIVAIVSGAR